MRLDSKKLHHANLLVGTREEADSFLHLLCDDLGLTIKNNPDFFVFRTDTFGIDEARQLRLLSVHKAITERKIFFISPERITLEAQNALLKTFEDPPLDTHFFLVTGEEALVLPTLRSRMQVEYVSRDLALATQDTERFLSLPIKERLLFAKKFVANEESLPTFLDNLLFLLKKQGKEQKLLRRVYNLRRFANDISHSPRLIIEHLSLVL